MALLDLPTRLERLEVEPDGSEAALLWRFARAGGPVAPMVVVPVAVEVDHYRLNNLAPRLDELFRGVDREDPDEDDLEELTPDAAALVAGAALLDEVIDRFYQVLAGLPARLTVRRDGAAAGTAVAHGRPTLLALKRLWAQEWSEESIVERVRGGGSWAPAPRPVLVHDAEVVVADEVPAREVLAGRARRAWVDGSGRVVRLELVADEDDAVPFGP